MDKVLENKIISKLTTIFKNKDLITMDNIRIMKKQLPNVLGKEQEDYEEKYYVLKKSLIQYEKFYESLISKTEEFPSI